MRRSTPDTLPVSPWLGTDRFSNSQVQEGWQSVTEASGPADVIQMGLCIQPCRWGCDFPHQAAAPCQDNSCLALPVGMWLPWVLGQDLELRLCRGWPGPQIHQQNCPNSLTLRSGGGIGWRQVGGSPSCGSSHLQSRVRGVPGNCTTTFS